MSPRISGQKIRGSKAEGCEYGPRPEGERIWGSKRACVTCGRTHGHAEWCEEVRRWVALREHTIQMKGEKGHHTLAPAPRRR
jgi:hypothetical protein